MESESDPPLGLDDELIEQPKARMQQDFRADGNTRKKSETKFKEDEALMQQDFKADKDAAKNQESEIKVKKDAELGVDVKTKEEMGEDSTMNGSPANEVAADAAAASEVAAAESKPGPSSELTTESTAHAAPLAESNFVGLTADMHREKNELDQQIAEEEQQKRKELLDAAETADQQQNYNQLQFLLEKSTLYTDYLLERMRIRQSKAKAKAERKARAAEAEAAAAAAASKSGKGTRRSKRSPGNLTKTSSEVAAIEEPGEDSSLTSGQRELGQLVAVFGLSAPDSSTIAKVKYSPKPPEFWPALVCKDPETSMVVRIVRNDDGQASTSSNKENSSSLLSNETYLRFFDRRRPDFIPDKQIRPINTGISLRQKDAKRWSNWEKNFLEWKEAVALAESCIDVSLKQRMVAVGDDTFCGGCKMGKKYVKRTREDIDDEKKEKAAGKDDVGIMAGGKKAQGAEVSMLSPIEDLDAIMSDSSRDKFSREVKGEKISDTQPRLFTGGVLRDYQVEGFVWLKSLFDNGINGILADEMGLGKTIQCIALIADLISRNSRGPFLIVAPLSTIPNWHAEFKRFTPAIPVHVHHGHKDVRVQASRKIANQYQVGPWVSAPVVLTSYEMVIHDRKVIGGYPWKCLIVDEGHRIKNMNCRLIKEMKLFNASYRLLLTGTPLQNNLSELWSLLNFLLPEIFDDLDSFHSWFDMSLVYEAGKVEEASAVAVAEAEKKIIKAEQENKVLSVLHKILEPFLLRRLKSDVKLDIPPKREVLVYAPLTTEQEEYYKSTVDKTILHLLEDKEELPPDLLQFKNDENDDDADVASGSDGKVRRPTRLCTDGNNFRILGGLSPTEDQKKWALKKVYADESSDEEGDSKGEEEEAGKKGRKKKPTVTWYEEIARITEVRERNRTDLKGTGTKTCWRRLQLRNVMMLLRRVCNHPFMVSYPMDEMNAPTVNIVNLCGKMIILDQMLIKLKAGGHKVLIFSQMTQMMDILSEYLEFRDYSHSRLDGSMNMTDRQEHIEAFNDDPDRFVFLLSTRAGGLGLNLMAADTVIIFDSDWNPQCDLQAQDRAHRIGQTRPVMVYRLVTANTIDQRIVERAAAKRKLEKMVIKRGRFQQPMDRKSAPKETMLGISPQELLALLSARDQDMVMRTTDWKISDENLRRTLTDEQLDKLLDRTDLYDKWDQDRRRRKRMEEGLPLEEEEKEEEAVVKDKGAVDEESKNDGLFSIVETTVGVQADDLI